MIELPTMISTKKEPTTYFDIDELPSIDEDTANRFIDIKNAKDNERSFLKRETFETPSMESSFKDGMYHREGTKIQLQFNIDKAALNGLVQVTGGLITTDIQKGIYEFDLETNASGEEEIYYCEEYVGEVIDGHPRIFKRMFVAATIRSMAKQEILFEYEPGKYTVHPDFMAGLNQMTQDILAKSFEKKGSLLLNKEKMNELLYEKSKKTSLKASSTSNKDGADIPSPLF